MNAIVEKHEAPKVPQVQQGPRTFRKETAYDWWKKSLAGENPPISADHPQPGFYRKREVKGGPYYAVAYWVAWDENGELRCAIKRGTAEFDLIDPAHTWTWVADKAVSEADFRHYEEHGRWPEDGAVAAPRSNLPDDPFERLKLEVDDKLEQAQLFFNQAGAKIESKVNCYVAANIAGALLKLNITADDLFDSEKKPIVKAGRAVDAKFKFRETVAETVKKLKAMAGAFMAEEERRLENEARAKREAELARVKAEREAEEARIAAERKSLEAMDPVLAHITPPEELPQLPLETFANIPKPRVQAGGGNGAKLGLRSVWTGTVIDYDLALAHFKNHPQVTALIADLAQGVARSGKGTIQVPGVEIKEERKL
jgi:hypothetical protein